MTAHTRYFLTPVDWNEHDMFEGCAWLHHLLWVALCTKCKRDGYGGKVQIAAGKFRSFLRSFGITEEAAGNADVASCLKRFQEFGELRIEGDTYHIVHFAESQRCGSRHAERAGVVDRAVEDAETGVVDRGMGDSGLMERDEKLVRLVTDGEVGDRVRVGLGLRAGENTGRVLAHSPSSAAAATDKRSRVADGMVGRIREAYPRHEKPRNADTAIVNAIARVADERFGGDRRKAADWLLERAETFARATLTWPEGERSNKIGKDFRPLPASWFNGGCYDEDESGWFRGKASGPSLTPAQLAFKARVGEWHRSHPGRGATPDEIAEWEAAQPRDGAA